MRRTGRRFLSLALCLLLLIRMQGITAHAEDTGYDSDDVTAFQEILKTKGALNLAQYVNVEDPATWEWFVSWSEDTPKKIISMNVGGMGLTGELDVSGLRNLTSVNCVLNEGLTELVVGEARNLTMLQCNSTGISALEVSKCVNLQELWCSSTELTGLDLEGLTNLKTLLCVNTSLTGLDVSGCTKLETLWCNLNPSKIGLSSEKHQDLKNLSCTDAGIDGDLDLSGYTNLKELYCSGNPGLKELTLPTDLQVLNCSDTGRSGELDLSAQSNLERLDCSNNPNLTSFTLGTKLRYLTCDNTGRKGTLDVSGCRDLWSLYCSGNPGLTGLKLNSMIFDLECFNTGLRGELDLSSCDSLAYIDISDNPGLTGLELGEGVVALYCKNTGIGAIDTTCCASLESLLCDGKDIQLTDGRITAGNGGRARVQFGIDPVDHETEIPFTLTAVPDSGYWFHNWTGLPAETSGTENPVSVTPETGYTYTANFAGGPAASSYMLSASAGKGGSIEPEGEVTVTEGDSREFAFTPRESWWLAAVEIDGAAQKAAETTYTFENVTEDHEIRALFLPYTDMSAESWYAPDAAVLFDRGVMLGVSGTEFGPEEAVSRGMAASMLWRMEGSPEPQGSAGFADVQSGAYYEKAIDWAAENEIAGGYGDKKFGPEDPVTREQLAAMLYRYAQYKGLDVSARNDLSQYTDAGEISAYAIEPMQWANAAGLLLGRTAAELAPRGTAARAEAAALLHRFLALTES